MEYSWTIKKKESLPFVKAGMKLGSIILISQSEKDRYHMITLVCESNEQNKLTKWKQTHTHRKQTDSSQTVGELRNWVKKVKD